MPSINVNGVKIAYETWGGGEPIALLHAWTGSKHEWNPQVPQFSKANRVIAMDLRGHGDSDKPKGEEHYSIPIFVDDLRALFDKLHIERAVVIGHSMGAMTALHFCLSYPERVKAAVLVGALSSAPPAGVTQGPWGKEVAREVQGRGMKGFIEWFAQFVFSPGASEELKESWVLESSKIPDYAALAVRKGVEGCNLTSRLSEIKVPVLVLVGEDEVRTPVAEAEKLNRLISDSWLKIIRGAGHMTNTEKPLEFNRVVLDFLRIVG